MNPQTGEPMTDRERADGKLLCDRSAAEQVTAEPVALDIRSISQSTDDARCLLVWFGSPVTPTDRQRLTAALITAPNEIERLQHAKRRALQIADERSKENNELRIQFVKCREAFDQIKCVCEDNADNSLEKSQQGMALDFVRQIATSALSDDLHGAEK